jgi:hypothetical protein
MFTVESFFSADTWQDWSVILAFKIRVTGNHDPRKRVGADAKKVA